MTTVENPYRSLKISFPDIRGWSGDNDRQFMYDRVVEVNAKSILEIGIYCGRMTAALAAAAKVTGGVVHSVDPWPPYEMPNGAEIAREFLDTVTRYRLQDQVKIYAETSMEFAAHFCGRFDLAWIDGGHTYDIVLFDIATWYPRSTAFYGHDWHIEAVRKAAEEYVRIWNMHIPEGGAVADNSRNWDMRAYKIEGTDNIWTLGKV
jgi:hypothetical protein